MTCEEDFEPGQVAKIIDEAKNGGDWQSDFILSLVVDDLEGHRSIHPLLAKYLAECLRASWHGVPFNKAFNISVPASRPSTSYRDIRIATDYFFYRSQGEKAEVSRLLAAKDWGLTTSTVKRICREYRQQGEKAVAEFEWVKENRPEKYKSEIEAHFSTNAALREDLKEEDFYKEMRKKG